MIFPMARRTNSRANVSGALLAIGIAISLGCAGEKQTDRRVSTDSVIETADTDAPDANKRAASATKLHPAIGESPWPTTLATECAQCELRLNLPSTLSLSNSRSGPGAHYAANVQLTNHGKATVAFVMPLDGSDAELVRSPFVRWSILPEGSNAQHPQTLPAGLDGLECGNLTTKQLNTVNAIQAVASASGGANLFQYSGRRQMMRK